jgi:hypothetical protein
MKLVYNVAIKDQYVKEITKQYGMRPLWPPSLPISVGTIGKFIRGHFHPQTDLNKLGISFSTIRRHFQELDYASENSVTITAKLAGNPMIPGSILSVAQAGVHIEFTKKNAILLRATNNYHILIDDLVSLESQIEQLKQQSKWKREWAVITEGVDAAGGTTVIISSQSSAKVDVLAKAGLTSTQDVNIADINANFSVLKKSYITTSIVGEAGLMPLFRAWTYKRHPRPVQVVFTKRTGRMKKISRNLAFLNL